LALVSHQITFVSRLGTESTRTTPATRVALIVATRVSGRGSSGARVVVRRREGRRVVAG
jgi:hypothetical protein